MFSTFCMRALSLFAEELDERAVFRQTLVGAVEQHAALLGVALADQLAGTGQKVVHEVALHVVELLDVAPVLLEELVVALGHRTRNDERRTGIVDQHGVHLVDDGEVVLALDEVFGLDGHVVTQVVEAELVVRTEGDVGHVGLAAGGRVGLVVVDAIHRQAVELVHRAHPLRVASGQVVVHRHHVDTLAGQCVQENGQGSHQGLSFARRHLGDASLV